MKTLHELDDMIVVYAEVTSNRDAYVVNQLISINDDIGTILINELNTNSNPLVLIQNTLSEILDDVIPQSPIIDDSIELSPVLSNFLENIILKDQASGQIISDYSTKFNSRYIFTKHA